MNDVLSERVARVGSRADFIDFIGHVVADYREHPEQWENLDIGSFLDAMAGFCQGIEGYYKNKGKDVNIETIDWQGLAQMILAATIYE